LTTSLIHALERHALERPDALAVREIGASNRDREITWWQLRNAAAALAGRLRRRGDHPVVMVSAANRWELLATMLGGLWADASVLPVAPELRSSALVKIARDLSVTTLIGESVARDALAGEVSDFIPIDSLAANRDGPEAVPPGGFGSILLQSSGTTGLPKFVRRGAPALGAMGESCRRGITVDENDTVLLAIPLYHSYGIDQGLLTPVMSGCCVELHERFEPARVRAALACRPISVFPGVPLIFDALAQTASGTAPSLRRALSAGSPLPRHISDRFQKVYGQAIGQIYGTTEFGSVTFNDPGANGFDPQMAGRPLPGVQLRIVDPGDPRPDHPLPPGSEGQVAVATPFMFSEYIDSPGAPPEGGFFLTGDLGSIDEVGTLRLTGRISLLVNVGGLKVNPLEVESVLMRHPAVREAIVVPVAYSNTASRLKAIIVPEPGHETDSEKLVHFAREHLIYYKVPRSIEIRTSVPRSPTGKILRQHLLAAESNA
jgi:acyl-CoA synthetase (AMP-forming)/AMP-acid ligase II